MAGGLRECQVLLPHFFVCVFSCHYRWSFYLRCSPKDTVATMLSSGFIFLLLSCSTSKQPCSVVKQAWIEMVYELDTVRVERECLKAKRTTLGRVRNSFYTTQGVTFRHSYHCFIPTQGIERKKSVLGESFNNY